MCVNALLSPNSKPLAKPVPTQYSCRFMIRKIRYLSICIAKNAGMILRKIEIKNFRSFGILKKLREIGGEDAG